MQTGKGQVLELILEDGCRHVRVTCPPTLIPSPGQYLLAGDGSDATLSVSKCSPLPVPLFYTDSAPSSGSIASLLGFVGVGEVPSSWIPGCELSLRGPLGRGFTLPASARRVGLVAFDASPARLKGLIRPALNQDAGVVLVCDSASENLPDDVEVQPLSALQEIAGWADYLAFDVRRENLHHLRERLGELNQSSAGKVAQVLVRTPVPCGAVAECGVCAVTLKSGWKLACKDGPVFDWDEVRRGEGQYQIRNDV